MDGGSCYDKCNGDDRDYPYERNYIAIFELWWNKYDVYGSGGWNLLTVVGMDKKRG